MSLAISALWREKNLSLIRDSIDFGLGEKGAGLQSLRMAQPVPDPIDQTKLPELAATVMRDAKFPMLASIDGDQPRLRPVSPVRVEGFLIHIANLRRYHKTGEIAANPKVELCYMDGNHDQVRITATAVEETDSRIISEIWERNPLLRQYLGTPENPELLIYRMEPNKVRFMKEWALEYYDVPFEFEDDQG